MAYEGFKEIRRDIFEPDRKTRKSYAVLFDKIPMVGGFFTRDGLFELKKILEAKGKESS